MRLLYTTSDGEIELTGDLTNNDALPHYAILSHTWQEGQEVTLDDFKSRTAGKGKSGWDKIRFCAQQAERDGLQYFWVDTCCIDKSNNAELSEAIISMFHWYQRAQRCYVYLSDVSNGGLRGDGPASPRRKLAIRKSRWFTRGWTLQEIIAPASVEFFSKEGTRIGDRKSLLQTLHEITGISIQALEGRPLTTFTVEERLSWAKRRETKRQEDAAYCLLGIFDVQIPPLYGEGRQKAMDRLLKEIKDYSIDLPIAEGASFDSHLEEHNARCLANTRTALLHSIADWAGAEDAKPIFWLSGMAGTGKSTIARTAAQSLALNGQLGASFFFKKGEGERGNASRFFSTIATNLVASEPGMLRGVRNAIFQDRALCQKGLKDQFEKLILHPMLDMEQTCSKRSARVIVVDALDECEKEEDIRIILQLLSETKNMRLAPLRILVTSRPELHIRLGFRQMPNGAYQDLALHEVPKNAIEHDIRLFYEHELSAIRQARMLSQGWPTADQVQALVELAVPLFIFAATVCRYIGTKGGDPEDYLDRVLQYQKSNFSQLDRTYLPVLEQLLVEQEEDEKEAWLRTFRNIVGSIVVLESPLSIASLARLLQVPQKKIQYRLDALHSVLSIPDTDRVPVRLLHLSFRDFLVGRPRPGMSQFWIDERTTHKGLASRCLERMSGTDGLRQNMCNLQLATSRSGVDEGHIASCLSPDLQYACRYWVSHLQQSQQVVVDGDTTHLFLQKHFLHWLEALSLMGELRRCVPLLNSLKKLVDVRC